MEAGAVRPVDPLLDEVRFYIRVAQRFGCSLAEAYRYPMHMVTAARVEMEIENIFHERHEKELADIRRKRKARESQQAATRTRGRR